MISDKVVRKELEGYLYAHFGVEYMPIDPLIRRVTDEIMSMFEIPDNWARVDGEWIEIPDIHYVTLDQGGWFIEHSLPCRVRGMWKCDLNDRMRTFNSPPEQIYGRYAVSIDSVNGGDGQLIFASVGQDD